mgnify:CR=1 FL=1
MIKFKKLKPNATIPTQGSEYAAGYDLYACIDEPVTIQPHETVKISTGIAVTPPKIYYAEPLFQFQKTINTFGAVFARSGLATKKGLRPANCVGVCDIDYTGEYIVVLHNDSNIPQTVEPNERIAQLVFIPYITDIWQEVDELEETKRGNGGFGSSGK